MALEVSNKGTGHTAIVWFHLRLNVVGIHAMEFFNLTVAYGTAYVVAVATHGAILHVIMIKVFDVSCAG